MKIQPEFSIELPIPFNTTIQFIDNTWKLHYKLILTDNFLVKDPSNLFSLSMYGKHCKLIADVREYDINGSFGLRLRVEGHVLTKAHIKRSWKKEFAYIKNRVRELFDSHAVQYGQAVITIGPRCENVLK